MREGFHFRAWGTGGAGGAGETEGTGGAGARNDGAAGYGGAGAAYGSDGDGGEDVYSKVVRAGKRTYFFDVKATRSGDYYLTVTESRKKTGRDGQPVFEKNKIFLYKEDFAKFADGLGDAVAYVKTHKPEFFESEPDSPSSIDTEFALL